MTAASELEAYLRRFERELRVRFVTDPRILQEVRDHLSDAVERGEQRGLTPSAAGQAAFENFGPADTIAESFAVDRTRLLYRGLHAGALVLGVAIAWVDSRPHWDDTGITAGALVLMGAVLGMLGPRRPWTWGLLVGLWIPVYAIARAPSVGTLTMLIVLGFPLIGAYAGRMVRRWITPVAQSHPNLLHTRRGPL